MVETCLHIASIEVFIYMMYTANPFHYNIVRVNGAETQCRTCQCTLTNAHLQRAFNDSQLIHPASPIPSNGNYQQSYLTFINIHLFNIVLITSKYTLPALCTHGTPSENDQKMSNCKCPASRNTESIGLGTPVGVLVVLLAIVTMGWMWTCWIMRKRARIITINTGDIR